MVGHSEIPEAKITARRGLRLALIGCGCANVALGVIGIFLPIMPSTVFFLIALWAFSKSSERLHNWLFSHRVFGRTLRDWHHDRVIPLRAKVLAVGVMGVSFIYVTFFVARTWLTPVLLALVLGAVAAFILTRPSRVPEAAAR